MEIKFINGINKVTGSCTWLKHKKTNTEFLVDCGMVQGEHNDQAENSNPFLFDPKKIKHVFLTHSHLDHCGLLPKLYKEGFTGKVYCSEATADLTKIILMDSSKFSGLYTENDINRIKFNIVDNTSNFKFGEAKRLENDLLYSCKRSSHILGSLSYTFLWKDSEEKNRSIFFSGDLGNNLKGENSEILQKSLQTPHANTEYLVLESTYGLNKDKKQYSYNKKLEILKSKLENFLGDDNLDTLIIPTFSQHRYQQIIFDLLELINAEVGIDLGFDYKIKASNGYVKWQIFNEDILLNENILEEEKKFILENCLWTLPEKNSPKIYENHVYPFHGNEYEKIIKNKLEDKILVYLNTESEKIKNILKKGLKNRIMLIMDSPMGNEINHVFLKHFSDTHGKKISNDGINNKFFLDETDENLFSKILNKEIKYFNNFNFKIPKDEKESKKCIVSSNKTIKKIILTSSGMCNEGRIIEYLKEHIENEKSMLWITGYQANNTIGQKLLAMYNKEYSEDQKKIENINLKNKTIPLYDIKINIDTVSELYSGHIFPEDIINKFIYFDYGTIGKNANKNTLVFLNHGTNPAREELKKDILQSNDKFNEPNFRKISDVLIPEKSEMIYDLEFRKWKNTDLSNNNIDLSSSLKEPFFKALEECLQSSDENTKIRSIELILQHNLLQNR